MDALFLFIIKLYRTQGDYYILMYTWLRNKVIIRFLPKGGLKDHCLQFDPYSICEPSDVSMFNKWENHGWKKTTEKDVIFNNIWKMNTLEYEDTQPSIVESISVVVDLKGAGYDLKWTFYCYILFKLSRLCALVIGGAFKASDSSRRLCFF